MKMKVIGLFLAIAGTAVAECEPETSITIEAGISKLKVVGFDTPIVEYFASAPGTGNMMILKNYGVHPLVSFSGEELVISAGDSCSGTVPASTMAPVDMSGSAALVGIAAYLMGSPGIMTAASMLMVLSPVALAQEGCEGSSLSLSSSLTVEIYADVDYLIHKEAMQGECPAESFWWKHHAGVFDGYEGCVGEKYYYPCAQDAQGANDIALYEKTPINWNGQECVETGFTYQDRTFWILWGDPLDKEELLERTGLLPTVKFPLTRGPYPSYLVGVDENESGFDDSSTAKAVAKDFLVYLGAITEAEKDDWYVQFNEGAEQGISQLWAAKALEIAMSTCNRNIYAMLEVPAYGYNNGAISTWVNAHSADFYEGEECLCFPNCKEPTVSVINVGYFPPNIPERLGGDNITYSGISDSPASPWFESMVFPENPSGVIKVPQHPNPNRRVCDGVYVWPMYFGMRDFKIPLDERPECSGWSYAITKGYSASVRAGFVTFTKDSEPWKDAMNKIMSPFHSLSYGSVSQWTWEGQMQLQQMIMSKPADDPTSWVGAYSDIMKEKWDVITDAFADCPVLELTNSLAGAYAFFKYKEPYLGLQDNFVSSFFMDVLGVQATTYNWGFRGADPSTYYGEGYGSYDFTRMQLYRDIHVYDEVARRAKIICADTSASIGEFVSIDDWATVARRNRRYLATDSDTRRALLEEDLPHLPERKLDRILKNVEMRQTLDTRVATCAPDFTTSCLFEMVGRRFQDEKF